MNLFDGGLMMNKVKMFYSNLSDYVGKNPFIGLVLLIFFAASGALLIYNFGKDVGEFIQLRQSS
jgi:hypothetical protein